MFASALNSLDGLIPRMELKARIKEAMGDMPNGEFARKMKVSRAAVTFWLSGDTQSLRGETANRMEALTGYRAGWIVTGKGPKKSGSPVPAEEASDHVLPDDVRRKALLLPEPEMHRLENLVRVYLDMPLRHAPESAKVVHDSSEVMSTKGSGRRRG